MDKGRKKRIKEVAKVTFLVVLLTVFVVLMIRTGQALYKSHQDGMFPRNVMNEGQIFSAPVQVKNFMPLAEIAGKLQETDYMIYPLKDGQTFDYESDLYAGLGTSLEGRLYIVKGSGNAESDVVEHIEDYYQFIGKTKPVFEKICTEDGILDSFNASYIAGYLKTGNFFKREDFCVTAVSYTLSEDFYVSFIYVTDEPGKTKESVALISSVARNAFQGDASVDSKDSLNPNAQTGDISGAMKEEAEEIVTQEDIIEQMGASDSAAGVYDSDTPVVSDNSVSQESDTEDGGILLELESEE